MASLSSSVKLGNTGVSGLIKSAQTIQNTISNSNDVAAKITWENSNYTDAAFADYSAYLNGRIKTLASTGSVTDYTKSLSMGQELTTATHSNISYQIQQENDGLMMAGDAGTSAGYAQKMDVLASQYDRAVGIGDMTLAGTLQTEYLSTDQSRQAAITSENNAQVTLDNANVAAFKSNETAIATGFTDAKTAIHDGIQNLMANMKNPQETTSGKPADIKSQLTAYVAQNADTYKALGVDLPKGSGITIGNLLEASFNAKLAYDVNAAHSLGGDPTSAAKFATFDSQGNVVGGDALGILNNSDYYNVPGLGNVNMKDAANISAMPNAIREVTKDGQTEFRYNAVTGYAMVNGVPMKTYSGEDKTVPIDKQPGSQINSKDITKQLTAAGFGDIKYNSDGTFTTKMTTASDKWLQANGGNSDLSSGSGKNSDAMGVGNEVTWRINAQGGLDAITSGNRLVHMAFDANNKAGLFQTLPNNQLVSLTGQYGFNQKVNTLIGNATTTQIRNQQAAAALVASNAKVNATVNATAKALVGGAQAPLAGSFMALHPGAGGGQPSHLIGPNAVMTQRAGGGFNFTQNGQAISAARYSQLTNTPFRTLLTQMAGRGDSGASAALGFVGNDYGYNPGMIGKNAGVYNALTWGVKPAAGGAPAGGTPSPSAQFGSASIGGLHL